MAEDEIEDQMPQEESGHNPFEKQYVDDKIVPLNGLYQNWFLEYASYVILERAVPSLYDGLKPVQRRILHSMREMEDGRYNKVANIIGNTMKYHPHGDASIGDALVQIGQHPHRRWRSCCALHRSAFEQICFARGLQSQNNKLVIVLRRPQQRAAATTHEVSFASCPRSRRNSRRYGL